MTLPNRPTKVTPPGSIGQPTLLLNPEELSAIVDAEYQHVDYDLHPLKVRGLDHYIDAPALDGRFHIS